jgi:iron complex transport system ATP-binding protein
MMEIEAKGIAVRFGATVLFDGVDLAMRAGEMVGLIGPNGSGKTTLLRVLANLRAPEGGRVRYAGRTAAEIGRRELARRIAYLAQGGSVHWPMRVEALVALGRLPHRRPFQGFAAADRRAIERAMAAADVASLRTRTMAQGFRRRTHARPPGARTGGRRRCPVGGRADRRARSTAPAAGDGIAANDRRQGAA